MKSTYQLYEQIGKVTDMIVQLEKYVAGHKRDLAVLKSPTNTTWYYSVSDYENQISDREYLIRRLKAFRFKLSAQLTSAYYDDTVKLKAA
jgi:hypothetical protein